MKLGARDRRALTWGAALVIPVLAWTLGVRPYRTWVGETREATARERELLVRERELLASAPSLPAELQRARLADSAATPRLFVESDGYAAAASLASHVTEAAQGSGVSVRQAETAQPQSRPDGLVELGLELQGEGDFEGILDFVRELETGTRLVQVTRIAIDRAPPGLGGTEALGVSTTLRAFGRITDSTRVVTP